MSISEEKSEFIKCRIEDAKDEIIISVDEDDIKEYILSLRREESIKC